MKRASWSSKSRRRSARNEFEPWFQPIGNIENGTIVGFEALARWPHAVRGLIPPVKFIPCAEQTGAIIRIGEQILEKACLAALTWPSPLYVAVNLSPVQFRQPQKLVAMVKDVLARTGLPPSRLNLEVTETLMMEDTEQTRAAIVELAGLGIGVSLDDFGSGFSSLSYIHSYPFSKIKIDKSFIDHIENGRESVAIVSAVRVLAEKLDHGAGGRGRRNLAAASRAPAAWRHAGAGLFLRQAIQNVAVLSEAHLARRRRMTVPKVQLAAAGSER